MFISEDLDPNPFFKKIIFSASILKCLKVYIRVVAEINTESPIIYDPVGGQPATWWQVDYAGLLPLWNA